MQFASRGQVKRQSTFIILFMKIRFVIPIAALLIGVILGFIICLCTVGSHWSAFTERQRLRTQSLERILDAERAENIVINALEFFRRDTGSFPVGGNLEAMIALRSHTPKDLLFIDRSLSYDAAGNLLDPWGTAYEIKFARDGERVVVTSAGPDRTGWTADDIRAKSE